MKNYIVEIIVGMLIISFVIEGIYLRRKLKKRNELQNEATLLMMQGKFKELYSFLSSAKVVKDLPKFYRAYLKMNGAIMDGKDSLIEESFEEIQKVRMNKDQKSEVYLNAFNYYVDKNKKDEVDKYKELLLQNTKEPQTIKYVERLYDTKILKNDKHLDELLNELNSNTKVNKVVDYLLLIEIYKNKGDKANSDKYSKLYLDEMNKSIK